MWLGAGQSASDMNAYQLLMDKTDAIIEQIRQQQDQGQRLVLGAILGCQSKHMALLASYEEEVNKLELKYEGLISENGGRVNAILKGEHRPKQEDCFRPELYLGKDVQPPKKPLPGYWGLVLQRSMLMIAESDVPALKSLRSVARRREEDWQIFEFQFEQNQFFSDQILVKWVRHGDVDFQEKECPIQWKPGKSLVCSRVVKKIKQKNKKGEVRVVEREEAGKPSFFDFFGVAESEEHMSMVIDVSRTLKEEVLPFSLLQYFQLEEEEEDDDEDGEDGPQLDDDQSDGEGEEDQESEEEEGPTKKKQPAPAGKDCKQQ